MNRETFFSQLADTPEPLAIQPEYEYRLKRLHRRLGDLRGKRVFEPGCGAGPITARLAEWVGPSGCICALDASAEMVAHCNQAVKGYPHIRTLHGKAETADLSPGAWELILCFRLYPHLEDATQFLNQCKQWLTPDGQLVIANLEGSRSLNEMHARLGPGVQDDIMPSAEALRNQLQADGWLVDEAIDEPEDYFLRARRP